MSALTACATAVFIASAISAQAEVPYAVSHSFSATGTTNPGSLIQGSDGNFYAVTTFGGAFNGGTLLKATPSGAFTTLYDFAGSPDGAYPDGLVQGADGNLYGITLNGGSEGNGTVFERTPNGIVTVLHSFLCADGCFPTKLVQASDGNLYGTTEDGGPEIVVDGFPVPSHGNIFRIAPDGTFTVLYRFGGLDAGWFAATFFQASDGNFYGTTWLGGLGDAGTIFRMTLDGTITDPASHWGRTLPVSVRLVLGRDGNFYGTLQSSVGGGDGAVFKMTPAGVLTVLHAFNGSSGNGDGSSPGPLLQAADGNIYGLTYYGGNDVPSPSGSGDGTVFRILPDGTVSTLYAFTAGTDGVMPLSLIQANDGNLYGTTAAPPYHGSVFRLTTDGTLTTIASAFAGFDGATPSAALIKGPDGNLYGTTTEGGRFYLGTAFRATPSGATTVIHSFDGTDGGTPRAALLSGPDAAFYGTTAGGGPSNLGTVFRLTADGVLTTLHAFTGGADGASPFAGLVLGADGALYGTTRDGGPYDFGTIFRVTPGGAYSALYQFSGGGDGGHPLAALVLGTDGAFYGTTSIAGASNAGTTFRFTPPHGLATLHAFSGTDGTGRDGAYPQASLLQANDGNFYGTTYAGGAFGVGTIFRMTPDGDVMSIHAFAGSGKGDGANPLAALIQGSNGLLYGTTSSGGTSPAPSFNRR